MGTVTVDMHTGLWIGLIGLWFPLALQGNRVQGHIPSKVEAGFSP